MKDLIKNILTETLTHKVIETYLGEEYPTSFNMDEFKSLSTFAKRIQYCEHHLKRISSGSGRIVYMIDDTKVLKLAKNQKGVAQIEVEADWGRQSYFSDTLAQIFDNHPDYLWIEMELARKVSNKDFEILAECNIDDMYQYLTNTYKIENGRHKMYAQSKELEDYLDENQFTALIRDFMRNVGCGPGDFGKLSTYGIVKRNVVDDIVIIDYGLSNNVYDSYYR
jgi:hypothetical protein